MGRRAAAHVFMPNVYVFPGGRVDYADRFAPFCTDYDQDTQDLLMQRMAGRPSLLRARMMGIAAIRETFEEVGIRIGRKSSDATRISRSDWQKFAETGSLPDLSHLNFLARAITPPGQKRRYDTRFFISDVSDLLETQTPVASEELEAIRWVTLAEAEELKTHFITKRILMAVDQALRQNEFGKKVTQAPFYRAKPGSRGKAKLMTILRPGLEPEVAGEVEAEI
ncbi:MAG: NUDIX hydrolase [Pseudomonadota bacterium]